LEKRSWPGRSFATGQKADVAQERRGVRQEARCGLLSLSLAPLASSRLLILQTCLCYAENIMMIRTSDIVSVFFLSR